MFTSMTRLCEQAVRGRLTKNNTPFGYCGEYLDSETGTIYLRARYYSPANGRFTTEDPIRDGLNWYAYCSNNPVYFIDPSGLIDEGDSYYDKNQCYDVITVYNNGDFFVYATVNYNYEIIGYSSVGEDTISNPTGNMSSTGHPYGCTCGGHSGSHMGEDLGPETPGVNGDSIYAATSGIVKIVNSEDKGGSGIYMTITSFDGKTVTQYMHLSSILVKDGQMVISGTEIAKMGNTGGVSGKIGPDYGSHLHFGVIIKGKYVDPEELLKKVKVKK